MACDAVEVSLPGGEKSLGMVEYQVGPTRRKKPPLNQICDEMLGMVARQVTFFTANYHSAGLNGKIRLTINGSLGAWGPSVLPSGPEDFQCGASDAFAIDAEDCGQLSEVQSNRIPFH